MSKPSDLVQATLDLLVLKILALQPLHGWALSQRLKQVSGGIFCPAYRTILTGRSMFALLFLP